MEQSSNPDGGHWGDRLFGIAAILGAVAYAVAARALPEPFFSDPLGPKAFPLMVAATVGLCGAVMVFKPDRDPVWPGLGTGANLIIATLVLLGYAYALKPLGFLIPTALTAAVLSWQINPRPAKAVLTGVGLSIGLFIVFKFVLGLGLIAMPEDWFEPAPTEQGEGS